MKTLKHLAILIAFIVPSLLNNKLSAQNIIQDYVGSNYSYYCIPDTISFSSNDSIRFVCSNNFETSKPTIFWLRGSVPGPILLENDDSYVCYINSLVEEKYFNNYNFIIISKPGENLIGSSPSYSDFSKNCYDYEIFQKNNWKNYYAESTVSVAMFLKHTYTYDKPMFLFGHSQGYHDACEIAYNYPNMFKKIVCLSSSPFDRTSYEIKQCRRKFMNGEINEYEASHFIDSIYNYGKNVKNYIESKNKYSTNESLKYYWIRNIYSYNFDVSTLDRMLQIDIPILVLYGFNDEISNENDLLPLIFLRHNKDNLTMHAFPSYDHNFFSNTNSEEPEFNWQKVSGYAIDWLSKE